MTADRLAHAAETIAARLACPPAEHPGHPQSLSRGATGIALLHIERAATGQGEWTTAHTWLRAAAQTDLAGGADATLFSGTPALAFTLHGAAAQTGRYQRALAALDGNVSQIVRRRLDDAHARIDRGERPALAEFDIINGLTGLGAHLRRRHRDHHLLRQILAYLVRLCRPLRDADPLPGWWTDQTPSGSRATDRSGGHANHSLAHGISGTLALLALAMRDGVLVNGQREAIERICSWLDHWRRDHGHGSWWPEIVSLDHAGQLRSDQTRPSRPSWCYGTPGMARAQQLAGQALGDLDRQQTAERAIAVCLTDHAQLRLITAPGLCHGTAGLFQTAWRITADASTQGLRPHVTDLAEHLLDLDQVQQDTGILDGSAGLALTLTTAAADQPPVTGWDAFMLLT